LNESCFTRAEVALQADHIAGLQRSAQAFANAARLFGASAEKIHGV
jgi:hypothetical protein